jgi:hypothetical protein
MSLRVLAAQLILQSMYQVHRLSIINGKHELVAQLDGPIFRTAVLQRGQAGLLHQS